MSLISKLRPVVGERQYAVVIDLSQQFVPITVIGGNGYFSGIFSNFERDEFEIGETINVLEIGLFSPHCLCLYEPPMIELIAQPTGAGPSRQLLEAVAITGLGCGESINRNFSLQDVQEPSPGIISTNYISMVINNITEASVSMAGLPLTMDGQTIELVPFLKVEHNFPLVGP